MRREHCGLPLLLLSLTCGFLFSPLGLLGRDSERLARPARRRERRRRPPLGRCERHGRRGRGHKRCGGQCGGGQYGGGQHGSDGMIGRGTIGRTVVCTLALHRIAQRRRGRVRRAPGQYGGCSGGHSKSLAFCLWRQPMRLLEKPGIMCQRRTSSGNRAAAGRRHGRGPQTACAAILTRLHLHCFRRTRRRHHLEGEGEGEGEGGAEGDSEGTCTYSYTYLLTYLCTLTRALSHQAPEQLKSLISAKR